MPTFFLWTSSIVQVYDYLTFDIFWQLDIFWHFDTLLNHLSSSQAGRSRGTCGMYPLYLCCLIMYRSRWGTWVMGHMGDETDAQWSTWVMGHIGMNSLILQESLPKFDSTQIWMYCIQIHINFSSMAWFRYNFWWILKSSANYGGLLLVFLWEFCMLCTCAWSHAYKN